LRTLRVLWRNFIYKQMVRIHKVLHGACATTLGALRHTLVSWTQRFGIFGVDRFRISHAISLPMMKPKINKTPEDFKLIDGPDRIVCWLRDGNQEYAEIFQERVTARDLVRLAEWMLDVASYLESVNKPAHTDKGGKKA